MFANLSIAFNIHLLNAKANVKKTRWNTVQLSWPRLRSCHKTAGTLIVLQFAGSLTILHLRMHLKLFEIPIFDTDL